MITVEIIDKLMRYIQLSNLPLATIEKVTGSSRRNIVSDINQVNNLFSEYDVNITIDSDDHLGISNVDLDLIIENIFDEQDYLFQQERPYMVLLYLFIKQGFVSVSHFQELFKMSKNSALSDITIANDLAKKFNVYISYNRKTGYELTGEDLQIRKLIDETVSSILKFMTGRWIIHYLARKWDIELPLKDIATILDQNEGLTFVTERLENVIYLLSILQVGPIIEDSNLRLLDEELEYINQSATYNLSKKIIKKYPSLDTQESYIIVQLLSVIQGNMLTDEIAFFKEIMEEIIMNVQGYTGSIFPDNESFRQKLYNHLVPFYFRTKFQIHLKNPLKSKMKEDYPDLFYLLKRSFKPLSKKIGFEISEDEVAYLVMHFGTYFTSSMESQHYNLTAVIICPHGMGTSILVRNLLSSVMPEINFIKLMDEEYEEAKIPNVDFVVSTVFYESDKPVYLVNPGMSHIELALLKRNIYERFNIQTKSIETANKIYDRIKDYLDSNNQMLVKSEIDRVVDEDLGKNYQQIKNTNFGPILTQEMITRKKSISDWREAIKVASQPLLEREYMTSTYIDSMISTIEKYGPYIVLAPEVAMPHAKPEDGAKKMGISLLQLEESVSIPKKDEDGFVQVKLFFVVSIADNHSHLGFLKKIHKILENDDTISVLKNAKSKKEILKILSGYDTQ